MFNSIHGCASQSRELCGTVSNKITLVEVWLYKLYMLHKSMYLCNSETFSFQIPTPFLSICFAYIFAAMSIYTMRQPPGYKCVKFCNVYRGIS